MKIRQGDGLWQGHKLEPKLRRVRWDLDPAGSFTGLELATIVTISVANTRCLRPVTMQWEFLTLQALDPVGANVDKLAQVHLRKHEKKRKDCSPDRRS